MIEVNIRLSGDFRELQATGHALYAPSGRDIVCSAFSILIYSLVDYVSKEKRANVYQEEIKAGNVKIAFKANVQEALAAFDIALNGIKLLADNYPDNIVIRGNYPENIK